MSIIIAGAGIGGLTLALALHKQGLRAEVYEPANEIKPLGLGINMPPHATQFMRELGLERDLAQTGLATAEAIYFNKHGQRIWSEPRGVAAGYDVPQYSIHRGELQMILLRAVEQRLGPAAVHRGFRLRDFAQSADGVTANFIDRRNGDQIVRVQGEAMIGADGIHSAVRHQLYPDEGAPIYEGRVMWRGTAEGAPFLTGRSMIWFGYADQKFMCYPISAEAAARGRSLINFVATRRTPAEQLPGIADWNRQADKTTILNYFGGWDFGWISPERLIADAPAIFEFPMIDRDPLPRWSHGRVTLLGDAAHPMYPSGSNGAAQAIVDGKELARLFAAGGDVDGILRSYDGLRRPATSEIVLQNRKDGPDRVLQMAEDRAPDGFADIADVIPHDELAAIARGYKKTAGFDLDTVNRRAS